MPYKILLNNKIHYNIAGNGDPLIFLHNGFYSSATWEKIREKLSNKFMVIDYDRFGYGHSDKFSSNINSDMIIEGIKELDELINSLNLKKVNLCGHCLGGAISLLYAAKYPEKINKVIAASVGYYSDHKLLVKSDWTFQKFDMIDKNLKNLLIKMHGDEYAELFWSVLCEHKNSYIMNENYNILDEVKKVKCPVLIINGDRDFYFSINHTVKAFKKIKKSFLWIVPDCGHDIHIEHEKMFVENINNFLSRSVNFTK